MDQSFSECFDEYKTRRGYVFLIKWSLLLRVYTEFTMHNAWYPIYEIQLFHFITVMLLQLLRNQDFTFDMTP